jgi:hypothetical protein
MLQLPTNEWSDYRNRIRDEYVAGWLTRTDRDVLIAIANLNLAGNVEPTNAQIALEATCDARSVRRTKAKAREKGLLGSQAQFDPVADGRRRQRANRYELLIPAESVRPKPPRVGGQRVRPIGKKIKKEAYKEVGIDLLAARRVVMQARLAQGLGMRC